ncbi:MAG: glycosyltransferase family 39 protein [Candidatus Thermoplasmatota archaeon]|nr:glycosyltransferase family 39 protein [Candidatus Thermoplasmatota archaeon]
MRTRESLDLTKDRFWWCLLVLGIGLHVLVSFTSDLGLDAHVHAAYVTTDDASGENRLDWGHTRPLDSDASDPEYGSDIDDRYAAWHAVFRISFAIFGISEFALHIGALAISALVLLAVWFTTRDLFGKRSALALTALVSIHPTFLFATGRANPEELMLLTMIGYTYGMIMLTRRRWILGIPLIITSTIVGVSIKGIPVEVALLVIVGSILMTNVNSMKLAQVLRYAGLSVTLAFIVGILISSNGTLSIVKDAPLRYLSAIPIAVFDVVLIYSLFGMVLWPFIRKNILSVELDQESTLIAGIVAVATIGITLYVSAQWTLESLRWDSAWPWATWTMGNNGRYASMIMVPAFWLLSHLNQNIDSNFESLDSLENQKKSVLIGILLILPISFLVGIHGQTIWTEEAAGTLSNQNMEDSDFLLVTDETMGMHWLYTFHLEVDPDNQRNITGHWRSDDSGWNEELITGVQIENRGNLSSVNWVILSPDIEWENPPENWNLVSTGSVDFLNGGGEWEMWSTEDEIIPY